MSQAATAEYIDLEPSLHPVGDGHAAVATTLPQHYPPEEYPPGDHQPADPGEGTLVNQCPSRTKQPQTTWKECSNFLQQPNLLSKAWMLFHNAEDISEYLQIFEDTQHPRNNQS